jgi:F-type H+-transporting ATPase subunit b
MELFNALGLDLKILFAQLINFAILLFVLWKFAYKPILEFMGERKNKIAQGVEDAEKAENKLKEAGIKEDEIVREAKKEAIMIIDKAKDEAEAKRKKVLEKAKNEIGEIINSEKAKMNAEKADTLKQIKSEVGGMIVLALEKVLDEKIDKKKDKELIQKVVKSLK